MKIKILQTSDIHGYIYPYSYGDGKQSLNGLSRINTLINSLRDTNTILIDNGDTIEGSPFTFYHYAKNINEPCPLSLVMKYMNYDYINLGNHDFGYGEKPLLDHIKNTNAKVLCSNVLYKGELLGPEYVVKQIGNKKLGLFGITTQFIPNWEEEEKIKNFTFLDAYETALSITNKLKEIEKVDYVVCTYHGGFERDLETGVLAENNPKEDEGYMMCENIKGLDVLLSGHQHRVLSGKLFNTYYTQPGQHGDYVACTEIDTDTDEIKQSLIKVETEADKSITDICDETQVKVQEWLDTPLGKTNNDLLVHDEYLDRLNKSQLITFINKVQLEISKADISGASIFTKATGLRKDITMRDIMSTYFFPNTLVIKRVTGKVLKEYLEVTSNFWLIKDDEIIINPDMDYPTPMYFNYDMLDGVEYTIKVSNPIGNRIISLTRNNVPIKDDDEFNLVINNYRSSGSGGYQMIKNSPTVKEITRSVSDLLAEYIEEKKVIDFEPINNIKVIK